MHYKTHQRFIEKAKDPAHPASPPPMKMANIITAYMVRQWKSLSESLGESMLIAVAYRNRRTHSLLRCKRWAVSAQTFHFIPSMHPDMLHDAWHCITVGCNIVKVTCAHSVDLAMSSLRVILMMDAALGLKSVKAENKEVRTDPNK